MARLGTVWMRSWLAGVWLAWMGVCGSVAGCARGAEGPADRDGDAVEPDDLPSAPDWHGEMVEDGEASEEAGDGTEVLVDLADPGFGEDLVPNAEDTPGSPASGFQGVDLQDVGHVRAMWASPEAGFWAVGDKGLILWFNGKDFVPAPLSPTENDLFGVSGEGKTVVAVGASGTVLRWDGTRWSLLDAPAEVNLYGVGVIGPNDFYVAGAGGALYRFQDGTWIAEATGVTYDLFGVHASLAGGVFAVGAYGTLIELRGGHWVQSQVALPTSSLRGVWRSPDGRIFVVGTRGAISVYDGLTWKIQVTNDPSDPPRDLYAVTGFSGDEVFAVGDRGAILAYNGKKWTLMTIAGPYNVAADLRGVAGILNPDGSRTVFAAGLDSRALRLEEKVWHDHPLGVTGDLNAVTVLPDGTVVAVGARGLILRQREGRFSTVVSGTENDLRAVAGRIVAGDAGTVLRLEEEGASPVAVPASDDWSDVWEVAGVTFLVGARGTLVRMDASGPQVLSALQGVPLRAVCETGGAVFAAGDSGRMFVDEGTGFHPVATGTFSTLWDLRPALGRAVLAVGDYGLILSCSPVSCRRIHEDPTTFLYGLGQVQGGLALAVGWAGAVRWIGKGEEVYALDPGTFRVFRAAAGVGPGGESYLVGPAGTFYVYRP